MRIDRARLLRDFDTLAEFGRNRDGGIDRPSFSAADTEARRWLVQRCRESGLSAREDGIGNLFITDESARDRLADAAPIWTGSHLDAVPDGGRFDGAAGVLAAVEVVRRLREENVALHRPVEAVAWSDEEGCYRGLLGSSAVADGITVADLDRVVGRDGRTLRRALEESGRDPLQAPHVGRQRGAAHRYLELHIEQGPLLEESGADIGVVTAIVGLAHGQVTFHGRADHAGTTPMDRRRDALRAAAAFVHRLPRLPADTGCTNAVLTCGDLRVSPGADNIVPGRAVCRMDVRDAAKNLAVLVEAVAKAAEECAADTGTSAELTWEHTAEPVEMDEGLRTLIGEVADRLGYTHLRVPSRAGHDAQKIAAVAPAAMVFVPSRDGRSHTPDEYTDAEQLARGADVLLNVVADLASTPDANRTPDASTGASMPGVPDNEERHGPA